MEWILKLAVAGGEGPCVDIMEISKPDDLGGVLSQISLVRESNPAPGAV